MLEHLKKMKLTFDCVVGFKEQTEGGRAGLRLLRARIADRGVGSLWYGALATAAATFVGHYPWCKICLLSFVWTVIESWGKKRARQKRAS
jgi:hypothetical protein